MKPERWQQITDLYHAAIARDPAQRVPFLDEACGGDDDLRRRVKSLVEAHEEAGDFIELPAFEAAPELLSGEPSNAMAGRVIGSYRVESLLGVGGMGEVYLAEDTRLGRRVALKILPAHLAHDQQRMHRFQQEARAASSLSHPNVAHIYEIGEAGGTHFIVMEYVEGQPLDKKIGSRPLGPADTLQIGIQIADALDEAHSRGVTHRDIKSSNIVVTPRGQVKVLDFGLAKLVRAAGHAQGDRSANLVKTDPGVVMGTVSYMSPEQALGREVDHRSDIFSLGVVLYEMATGRLPFAGASVTETIDKLAHAQPEAMARFNYDVPEELERIVKKTLRKDREDRYQTFREMLVDLRSLRQELDRDPQRQRSLPPASRGNAGPAPPMAAVEGGRTTSSAEYLIGEIKRHRAGALIVLAMFVAALGGVAFVLYTTTNPKQPAASFQRMRITKLTSSGRATTAAISPDGRYVVHVISAAGRESLWLRQVATTSDKEINPPDGQTYLALTFSPDGNFIYYVGKRGSPPNALYRIPVLGGAPKKVLDDIDSPVSFSPDGGKLAFVRFRVGSESIPGALLVANADGTGERILATRKRPAGFGGGGFGGGGMDGGLLGQVAWSPDGRVIACNAQNIGPEGRYMIVVTVPAEGGEQTTVTAQRWYQIRRLAWLADGSGLILGAADDVTRFQSQQLWHLFYPGGEARRITNDLSDYRDVSLSADSTALVAVQIDRASSLWIAPDGDAARARQITTGVGRFDGEFGLAWTPDGRLVHQSSWDIWSMGPDAMEKKQLTADAGVNYHPAVSPDGRSIAFVSERTGGGGGVVRNVWRMDIDGGSQTQLTFGVLEDQPQFTPDGRWIFYVSSTSGGQRLSKMPADGGEPVRVSDRRVMRPVISPDGGLIAAQVWDEQANTRIAVLPVSGGKAVKLFDVQHALPPRLRWSTDGRAILYVADRDGVSNIWSQPIDGDAPSRLTDFKSDRIFSFDWSRDGKWLAVARGAQTSDIVLIRDFR